jgi:arylsulfatase A-like enzyme
MHHLSAILAAILTTTIAASGAPVERPNIVVILADDLGYGDVQCYNPQRGKIATPHIDALAATGMRFTDAHSSSGVCSPSRYTLLTGRYHWRTRLQSGIVGYLEDPLIAADRMTVAGFVRQHGYHTACIGKWHLGWRWDVPREERALFAPGRNNFPEVTRRHREAWSRVYSRPIAEGPITRGFQEYFGTDVPNWPPYCFIHDDRTVGIPTTFLPRDQFQNHLASLPGPAIADWRLEEILPTLAEQASDYIRRRARSSEPFFLYMPLTSPHTPLAVSPPWRGRSGLDSAVADFVMQTDDVVGRILAAVEESGVAGETLVIFTSDNGFAPYVGAKHLEARGHFPSGPLRGYKGDAWEGGHRVPFIARWPEVIPAGAVCDQLAHHADLLATVAELLRVDLPGDAGEDSYSLWPLLRGGQSPVRDHAVSQGSSGLSALRLGTWKLIFGPGGGGAWSRFSATSADGQPGQLYDLAEDLAETENRYGEQPAVVAKMTALMEQLAAAGRSTPGPERRNDVPVRWQRFLPADR